MEPTTSSSNKTSIGIVILIVVAAGIIYYWNPANLFGPAEPINVTYHVATGGANEIRSLIIKKYEIDKKYGLDIEFVSANPGEIERLVISGEAEMGEISIFAPVAAYEKGNLLKIIAPALTANNSVAVLKDFPALTLSELKGAHLVVRPKASATYASAALSFKAAGMDIEKDFKLTFGLNTPQAVEAMEKGEVGAALVSYPGAAQLFSTGKFRDLGDVTELWIQNEDGLPMPLIVLAVQDKWFNENKSVASRITKMILDSSKFIQENPKVISELTEYLAENEYNAPEVLKLVEENTPLRYFTEFGDTEIKAFKRLFERAKENGILSADAPSVDTFLVTPSELGL